MTLQPRARCHMSARLCQDWQESKTRGCTPPNQCDPCKEESNHVLSAGAVPDQLGCGGGGGSGMSAQRLSMPEATTRILEGLGLDTALRGQFILH